VPLSIKVEAAIQGAGRHLILYDGVCGLCNRLVTEILHHDPNGLFHFASLQSSTGRSLLARYGRNPDALDNMYVIEDYKKDSPRLLGSARAALFVVARLESPWRFLRGFGALPTFVLDALYKIVARHRYRTFGKLDHCLIPTAEYANRFVEGSE
jgi:predicted DCC family thiol-disulfide oxidoreductase YuxK